MSAATVFPGGVAGYLISPIRVQLEILFQPLEPAYGILRLLEAASEVSLSEVAELSILKEAQKELGIKEK